MKSYKIFFLLAMIAVVLIGFSPNSLAEEQKEEKRVIGFKFGIGYYALLNDDRFDGSSNNFSLIIPIDAGLSAAVYHESGNITGKQDGKTISSDLTIYELRVSKELATSKNLSASVFLGAGNGEIESGDFHDSSLVADIGAELSVLKNIRGTAEASLSVNLLYRYFNISPVADVLTDDIDDLGGFVLGLNLSVLF
ncbi:MAG TPA: hypothetical protein ENI07_16605 [Desulfobacterales bacterium]|nr:hypothetical protein [Desulfobacterales bacterium]